MKPITSKDNKTSRLSNFQITVLSETLNTLIILRRLRILLKRKNERKEGKRKEGRKKKIELDLYSLPRFSKVKTVSSPCKMCRGKNLIMVLLETGKSGCFIFAETWKFCFWNLMLLPIMVYNHVFL